MEAAEIRAIRGNLSRPAFARLLGVTALTVLRWELPSGSKEARRPRARMIEELRRLASDGVGADATLTADDEDDDASEPVHAPSGPPESNAREPFSAPAIHADDARVLNLLPQLLSEHWEAAEHTLLSWLAEGELQTVSARTLASLGVIQMQVIARLEVHAALTALSPILEDAARGALPTHVAARAHMLGAVLFGAPDSRLFDPGRVNVHAALAEALLPADEDDLRVLVAMARASASRFVGPQLYMRAHHAAAVALERARAPLSLCVSSEMRGIMARIAGDIAAAERLEEEALARAAKLAMPQLLLSFLSNRVHRLLRGAATPSEILAIAARARHAARGLPPAEPLVRLLAAECQALQRLGRFNDAERVLNEVLAFGASHGLPVFAIVVPAAQLLLSLDRVRDLERLADALSSRAEQHPGRRSFIELHVLIMRAVAALPSDPVRAAELAARACQGIEALGGIASDYIAHDACLILLYGRLLSGDLVQAHEAVRVCEALYERRPSLWHAAVLRRVSARIHSLEGRLPDAQQKLEAALATLQLLGDLVQEAQCQVDLAIVAQLAGAPDADSKVAVAQAELARLGIPRTEVPGAVAKRADGAPYAWTPQSLTERLAVGVERLSIRGLSSALMLRELTAILCDVFPTRASFVDHGAATALAARALNDTTIDLLDADGQSVRFGVVAANAEQRAALRILGVVLAMRFEAMRGKGEVAIEPAQDLDPELPGFIAAAPATRELRREIGALCRSSATALITGESGSGKEVVARALHDLSPRAHKPYVAFNCGSVPRELFEGQLFGYRRGAFTGAMNDSPGVIRAAEGGTLFLDEIGELPLETQPKLLRFLENGEVFPLGEQKPRRVDVRVLAATHRDLGRLVREGRFREDLYYRLNVVPISVPPLRERREDILALARMFVAKLAPAGSAPPELSADAAHALKAHTWPGNVRELRNVIERAMAYTPVPPVLEARHLRILSVS